MATATDSMRREGAPRIGSSGLMHAVDLQTPPEAAFAVLCEVEKWPVWLSFLRSARLAQPGGSLTPGAEVLVRSAIPGDEEQLYEVDQYIENHMLALVGAYSVRRRIDFRIERKTTRSKMTARIDYPTYGGRVAAFVDRLTKRRKLSSALAESMVHFKGLVEYRRGEAAADDLEL
ncbi:MAG: SRPBCC family protein [Candidatus Eremiobacteraeota bacterium]|nr:SRPBCC family protein [Candidatus Eremiobacteraeota bacterium]